MDQCNDCTNKKCRTVDWYRKNRDDVPPHEYREMLTVCHRRVVPKPFTRPLFETAILRNAQGVHDVLQKMCMRLAQKGNRWSLIHYQSEGRNHYGKGHINRKTKRH